MLKKPYIVLVAGASLLAAGCASMPGAAGITGATSYNDIPAKRAETRLFGLPVVADYRLLEEPYRGGDGGD